jgi:hypothetical protein
MRSIHYTKENTMEISENHVVLPREDFHELNTAAHDDPSVGTRVASTTQTFFVFGALAAGVTGAAFGVAKATDWLEERRTKRTIRLAEAKAASTKQS